MTTQEARFIERGLEFLQAIDGNWYHVVDIDYFDHPDCGYGIYLTLTNGETITVDNEYDSIEVIFDS